MNLVSNLKACFAIRQPVLIMKSPGQDVTSPVANAAAESQRKLIRIVPHMERDMIRGVDIRFYKNLDELFAANDPTVLFIDGLDGAYPRFEWALVALAKTRRIFDVVLPDCVTVVAVAEVPTRLNYDIVREFGEFSIRFSMT